MMPITLMVSILNTMSRLRAIGIGVKHVVNRITHTDHQYVVILSA